MAYFLRVEAVNLANFVFDTNDLSTTRGGGLLLIHLWQFVADQLKGTDPVSRGASVCVFPLGDTSEEEAESTRLQLEEAFREHDDYRHATVTVDVARHEGPNFTETEEALTARCRWRQLQQPSTADWERPTLEEKADPPRIGEVACRYTRTLPATEDLPREAARKQKSRHLVSASAAKRYRYGRKHRLGPLKECVADSGVELANDFQELSHDPSQGNLSGKVAVLYADGNQFRRILRENTNTADDLRILDEQIRTTRSRFMTELLARIQDHQHWWTSSGKLRLAVLLWGGDEFRLVVPAWCGWRLAAFFFQLCERDDWRLGSAAMRHSAGLVFCSDSAPIQRIIQLSGELADDSKTETKRLAGPNELYGHNALAYHVLETFDYVGPALRQARIRLAGGDNELPNLILKGPDLGTRMLAAADALAAAREEVPRGKLYELVGLARSSADPKRLEELRVELRRVMDLSDQDEQPKALPGLFGDDDMFWVHVVELWDYLTGEQTDA